MFLGVAIVSVILTACTDSEIKKMNGEWETISDLEDTKLVIKNGKVKIIDYSELDDKEHAERSAVQAKIYKEGNKYEIKSEYGISKEINLIGDNIVIEDMAFTKIK